MVAACLRHLHSGFNTGSPRLLQKRSSWILQVDPLDRLTADSNIFNLRASQTGQGPCDLSCKDREGSGGWGYRVRVKKR